MNYDDEGYTGMRPSPLRFICMICSHPSFHPSSHPSHPSIGYPKWQLGNWMDWYEWRQLWLIQLIWMELINWNTCWVDCTPTQPFENSFGPIYLNHSGLVWLSFIPRRGSLKEWCRSWMTPNLGRTLIIGLVTFFSLSLSLSSYLGELLRAVDCLSWECVNNRHDHVSNVTSETATCVWQRLVVGCIIATRTSHSLFFQIERNLFKLKQRLRLYNRRREEDQVAPSQCHRAGANKMKNRERERKKRPSFWLHFDAYFPSRQCYVIRI